MTDHEQLRTLLNAGHPCIAMETFEEEEARRLVATVMQELGRPFLIWSSAQGVRDGLLAQAAPVADTQEPAAACQYLRQQKWGTCSLLLDVAGHLGHEPILRELRELVETAAATQGCVLLVDHKDLPPAIRAVATQMALTLPDEKELEKIVTEIVRTQKQQRQLQVKLSRAEAEIILRNLKGLTRRQARQVVCDAISQDGQFDITDLNCILAEKRRLLSGEGLLEYIEAPVNIDDIGGLKNLKKWLGQRQEALGDAARAFGIPAPRGLLLLGVQGAGKSLAAKAVATAWGRPLMRMDPSVLFDRYIGESERRLRDALAQAEAIAPLVLWVDEIEKGFASAASQSVDGGLSKRMFGTLLTWMQEHKAPVFLIATANDIESLPPELLRKGRFDEVFFVDLPEAEARAAIFRIHLRKRKCDPETFDLARLVEASAGFSGAEIEQAIVGGLCAAFAAKTPLNSELILQAVRSSPPLSVTMAEKVAELRAWAQGRCVPAD